ncbi:bifunctional adenosylcobinamide kinase/adenosylcobinamide-phosphate guanylyltransferase [Ferrimonas sp. SCSIO 43195]|uniref:bifunctional adenosylcobinamide kinase/adenosylcobinamide-phosphate guanylyltransferase n=1 Tax=Ferrimonas sp. SCSIO 43195 TaxID=2822844 RepID=UPI00207656FC|nr:bifunctional adenosylcobinamide kinase/adenosylcobinamide-phosphate guanylyltransferase [Ferrimonas sp. SCSIO 43195]USD39381.1 bifunctional adenosylcobinamide kinase/adenosylcobinamide-phosphate guanylyltransferase [Ferrimonas sp. SCSIO 43195]
MISLYLGGARSGKSGLAEDWCLASDKRVLYVATARSHPSMAERIELHRQRRPAHWRCVEEPLNLVRLLQQANADELLLIDCLTLWLTNQLLAGVDLDNEIDRLGRALSQCSAEVVLVSTEVGQGLIPDDSLSRSFVCASGQMHQAIAAIAQRVQWCQAGIEQPLKDGIR